MTGSVMKSTRRYARDKDNAVMRFTATYKEDTKDEKRGVAVRLVYRVRLADDRSLFNRY